MSDEVVNLNRDSDYLITVTVEHLFSGQYRLVQNGEVSLSQGYSKPRFRRTVDHAHRKLLSPHQLFRSCYGHRLSTKTAFESGRKLQNKSN